jgi:hypothetical protein
MLKNPEVLGTELDLGSSVYLNINGLMLYMVKRWVLLSHRP